MSGQLDKLLGNISGLMPENIKLIQQDIESNLKSTLQNQLTKLDLVSREEYDVQQAVLLKTREKVEALEKRVAALEKLLS